MANANPKTSGLWLRLSLSRITFIVWLAWFSSVVLMWGMYRFNVMHPHFLPLTTLMVIQLIGGLAVLLAGLWALVRGPQRARAFSWLLLGTTPIWLWAAHISYGMWVGHSRSVPWAPGPVVKLGAPAASALLDGIVRYRYPNRLEGQRVVMVYDQVPDPTGDVAAMDRVVQQMEELLGQRCKTKVHWIRGGVIGLGPKYNQGLAFGPAVTDQPGLTWIDRHEVAHFVLHHHCGPDSAPPNILVEGWAETQSGYEPGSLARRAWRLKRNDEVLTLRELTNDDWYNNREGRIYTQGGVLVEFILREYGPKKLFEFYTTCRPKTFADDCGRILGVDLDELDRRCWADVEKQVSEMGELYGPHPFQHVKVGEGVNLAAWNVFIEQYLSGQKQLEAPYRQVQLEIESTKYNYSADGTTTVSAERFVVAHDGDRHRRMHEEDGYTTVAVAAPSGSFILNRKSDDSQWTRAHLPHPDMPRLAYSYCRSSSQDREESLRIPNRMLLRFLSGPNVTITAFEQFAQDGRNRVKISYRDSFGQDGRYLRHGSVEFRQDAYCTLQFAKSSATYKDVKVAVDRRLEIEYGPTYAGVPVVRAIRSEFETSDNSHYVKVICIPRCDFVPTPEKEFTLAAFDVAPPGRWAWFDKIGVPWHMVVTCSGAAISLVLGMTVQGWQLVRKR